MIWKQQFTEQRLSGAAHMFTLHLGVADRFILDGQFVELKDVLQATPPLSNSAFLASYNRGTGIQFGSREIESQFLVFLKTLKPRTIPGSDTNIAEAEFLTKRRQVEYMFELFSEMLEIAWTDTDAQLLTAFKKAFPTDFEKRKRGGTPFFSVTLDYEASISPHGSLTCSCAPDRNALVTLLTWGVNRKIADAGNTVLLVTEHLGNVAEELTVETNGIVPIEIPFLSRADREETTALLAKNYTGVFGEYSTAHIARISAGMTRRTIGSLAALARYQQQTITDSEIFRVKKKHLEEQGNGMITIQRPLWGSDAIGGLSDKKEILEWVARAMLSGNRSAVPQGIGFFGGPGLGKTVCVQALAQMTSLEVITLRNMMSMWVGESERNTTYIMKKVVSYGPAIVVIDEFDTAFQKRGSVFHGDSGVSSRVMQQFLEIMSDTDLRGHILWIIVSNRPQDIDDAFLRPGRLDLVLPFLPPTREERIPILAAILHKITKQEYEHGETFWHEVNIPQYAPLFADLCHGHHDGARWVPCDRDTHHQGDDKTIEGFTGAEIECIVTNANRDARREGVPLLERHLTSAAHYFKPTRDMAAFNRATIAALKHCNDVRYIDASWREKAWGVNPPVEDTSTVQFPEPPRTQLQKVDDKDVGQYL